MTDDRTELTRRFAAECDELHNKLAEARKQCEYHKQTATDALRLASDAIESNKAKQEGIDRLREKVTELSVLADSRVDQCECQAEAIRQFKASIGYASVTIAVLRSQVDDLTKENTALKTSRDTYWATL